MCKIRHSYIISNNNAVVIKLGFYMNYRASSLKNVEMVTETV